MTKKVLITGAAGTIGTVLRNGLVDYELTLVDIKQLDAPNFQQIDIAHDYEKLRSSFDGQDVIIHLARNPREEFGTKAYVPENYLMSNNIYSAAYEANPRPRVIVASSVHVAGSYIDWNKEPYCFMKSKDFANIRKQLGLIMLDIPPFPDSPYGAMKVHMEFLGKYYSSKGLQVVALRLGGVNPENDPSIEYENWCTHSTWLSHRDCVEIFRRCVEAELSSFTVLYATSNNKYNVFDISETIKMLGYTPQDDSARYLQA